MTLFLPRSRAGRRLHLAIPPASMLERRIKTCLRTEVRASLRRAMPRPAALASAMRRPAPRACARQVRMLPSSGDGAMKLAKLLLLLPLTFAGAVGPAAGADDRALCATEAGDEAIAACTRLIGSGRDKDAELGALYRHRCAALTSKWDRDRSVSDCNEAVRLDPGNSSAFAARGHDWRINHDDARALEEMDLDIML